MKRCVLLLYILCLSASVALGCTSLVATGRATASGAPMLWKHRDTGADNNFLARVVATDSTLAYVGLFNAGDSLLAEAWTGMNEAGFAIMNTASYNLAPDTARLRDREGAVMTAALRRCRSVDDFERLLATLPRPMGVQANFGVIDAGGHAAYFETSDHSWRRYDTDSVAIRTNHSLSGTPAEGNGYIRLTAAKHLTRGRRLTPRLLADTLSRSFYHGLTGRDYLAEGERYVANSDFIPRDITRATIVIESRHDGPVMWAGLGYTPCARIFRVTLDDIPDELGPTEAGWRSPACTEAVELGRRAIPHFAGGDGPRYLNLHVLAPLIREASRQSIF